MYHFAYLTADLILLVVWLFLFFHRKDLRFEMLIMSCLSLFWIGITFVFFAKEFIQYTWTPDGIIQLRHGVYLEDVIYTFIFGGIASVIYEEFLGKKHLKKYRKQNKFIVIGVFPLLIFISMFVCIRILHINPFHAAYIGFLISAIFIFFHRKDLVMHAIISGLFLSLCYFIIGVVIFMPLFPGIVQKWWHLQYLTGVILLGVPLDEILWAFFFGLFIGPAYEFLIGTQDR